MFYKHKFLVLALVSAVFFGACVPSDDNPTNSTSGFENGVLIINEGPFNSGTGTIFHHQRESAVVSSDIFASANSGAKIGNILQSCTQHNGKAFLMVNNADKVLVVDAKTFKFQDSIGGIKKPRFFQAVNSTKAFISSWVSGVNVVNLTTNKVEKSIKVGVGADRMLLDGTTLWVLNSGGFSKDSTISIIDVNSNTLTKNLKAGLNPNSITAVNGSIWVLCGSYFDAKDKGLLIEYKNGVVINSYLVPKYASNLVLTKDNKRLLFLADGIICQKDLSDAKIAPSPYITEASTTAFEYLYGLDIDPSTGNVFVADAKNFANASSVYIFEPNTKVLLKTLAGGIATNGFYFGK